MALPAPEVHPVGPDVIAAIDIGTNSVHMVVARVAGASRFEVLTKEKDVVRLGSGASDMKRLDPDAIERGIVALDRCRRIAETHGAQIVAVATSAVREAENRDEFIRRAHDEAGVDIEVISGFEEARLIHLGVLQAVAVYEREIMLCDIGGGSTELLIGKGEEILAARSLKLGAIRLTQRHFPDGDFNAEQVELARNDIRDTLLPFVRDTRHLDPELGVGSSGTVEALCAMAIARRGEETRSLNAAKFTRKELGAVIADVIEAGAPESVKRLPGADPTRGDILLAGALILEEVMEGFGLDEMMVSEYALREGVLLDAVRRRSGESAHLADIRRQGVLHLMELAVDDPDHGFQTAWIADELYRALEPELEISSDSEEILEAAALLSNVGLWISHSRHHQHSYYVIRSSEHLTGFTDREIELIAQVARYHRKSAPSDRHPAFAALSPADRQVVCSLAAILRIAIGLDRSHAELVQSVTVDLNGGDSAPEAGDQDETGEEGEAGDEGEGEIVIRVGGADPDADLSLEVWSANQRSDLLAEVLGRPVRIEG